MDSEGRGADGAVERSELGVDHQRCAGRWSKRVEALLEAPEEDVAKNRKRPRQYDLLRVEGAVQLVENLRKRMRDLVQEPSTTSFPASAACTRASTGTSVLRAAVASSPVRVASARRFWTTRKEAMSSSLVKERPGSAPLAPFT